jgi:type I site-specific restriction-modification system R (restriction) subunit
MWITGFDAPSCSTIYLDKPMRNYTANRVFEDKVNGLIVDYIGFPRLAKNLAIYGSGSGGYVREGDTPVQSKAALVNELRSAAVKVAIEEALDQLPESYSTETYQRNCQQVYQHVYECYSETGRSIYTTAAC